MPKLVNYDKLRSVSLGAIKNPDPFQLWLEEVLHKHTNLESREDQIILKLHFISYSAPDIRKKLPKLQLGPQTKISQLVSEACSVFRNHDGVSRGQMRTG